MGQFTSHKLFKPGFHLTDVETEAAGLRVGRALGVPAPAFECVTAIDDRHGVVMERIEGPRLYDSARLRPWTWLKVATTWADLYAMMHSCTAPELPSQRERLLREIENNPDLSAQQKKSAVKTLEQLPDAARLCLSDFRPRNILMSKDGPVVVDWESALRGNPMADIAFVIMEPGLALQDPTTPQYLRHLVRTLFSLAYRGVFLRRYMKLTNTRYEDIASWKLPVAAARLGRGYLHERAGLLKII
jgi:aminoglycoside phosphotransferase (APT) family kinase protein